MTEQIIEAAKTLKAELSAKFEGKPIPFMDAVIRVAHALLLSEAEAEHDEKMAELADRSLAKLSGRTIETLRA